MSNAFAIYPSLKGKVVNITGGAGGIGMEMVRAFAAQASKVGFVDLDEKGGTALAKELQGEGASIAFAACDLRDVDQLRRAFGALKAALGPASVLVNNAARDDRHRLEDVTPAYWDENLAVNLRHQVFAAQAVAPQMAAAGGGSIINLGSVSWMRGRPAMVAYTTAKAAISGLTRVLARELGERNIRVNAIVPGAIHTARQAALWDTPEGVREFLDQQALKFRLSEDDVARTALFLASEEARGITGQNLIVDAGLAQTSAS